MRCPRCSVTEIPESAVECPLCGYRADRNQVTVLPSDAVDERVQTELGLEFHIERELWRTDESRCYLAREASGRSVDLVVVSRPSPPDAAMDARFQRAIEQATTLDHPHVLPVLGSGTSATLFWVSTRHHEARPLHDLLRQFGPLDLGTCRRLVEQVASALDHAHRRGVTHGDVATSNILVDADGWAFVTNFCLMQAIRGISQTRHGGPSGDQRDLGMVVAKCLNLPADSASVPPTVMQAIQRAASPELAVRFPTLLDFVAAFTGAPTAPTEPPAPAARTTPPGRKTLPPVLIPDGPDPGSPRRKWLGVLVGAVLAVAAVLGVFLVPRPKPVALAPDSTYARARALAPIRLESHPPALPLESLRAKTAPPVPAPAPAQAPVTTPEPAPQPAPLGQLSVNSTPWGQVFVDGDPIGNTPRLGISLRAGPHTVRIVRDGFQPYERQVVITAGAEFRLTDLVLSPK